MNNLDEIIAEIKNSGIFKIDSYLSNSEVIKIRSELNTYYDQIPDGSQFSDSSLLQENSYLPGKALVFTNPGVSIPISNQIFQRSFFVELSERYLGKDCQRNLQTFSTYEYRKIDQSEWPRNFYPHFDPFRALKFFIYLHDTEEINGAFKAIPGSHNRCKEVRQKNTIHSLLKEKYMISQHPELVGLKDEDYMYYTGKAGTLLIFDTDIAHSGGIIKENGLERMVILNHNR